MPMFAYMQPSEKPPPVELDNIETIQYRRAYSFAGGFLSSQLSFYSKSIYVC